MTARRLSTVLAVGLVAAVGAAAVVESLRPDGPAPVGATEPGTTDASDEREAAALRAAGAVGILVVSRPNCRVDLLALPDLTATTIEVCARLEHSGRVVTLDGRLPSPADNLSVASCAGPGEGVLVERDGTTYMLPGCGPAWRPDGLLTVVDEGELWGATPPNGLGVRLLARRDLRRLFAGLLSRRDSRSLNVREVAWLSDTRLFAILSKVVPPRYLVATLEGRRIVSFNCCWEQLGAPRVTPGGNFVSVDSEIGALVFDRDGGHVPLGVAMGAGADVIAWSPGDRLVAAADEDTIVILEPGESGFAQVARLPFGAADVGWIASERDLVYEERN